MPALFALMSMGSIPPAAALNAQVPEEGEVRQLVTFAFLPGRAADAVGIYRERALPLYRQDKAMLAFRAFREVESSIPLDLIIVRGFRGMAGMDASNEALRRITTPDGTGIGALYREIGALTRSHTDQFVEMLPALGSGDPASARLTVLIWYRVPPGEHAAFELALAQTARMERERGVHVSTGRLLIADGWDYLRFVGVDSLAEYQDYVEFLRTHRALAALTAARREVVVANVAGLALR